MREMKNIYRGHAVYTDGGDREGMLCEDGTTVYEREK